MTRRRMAWLAVCAAVTVCAAMVGCTGSPEPEPKIYAMLQPAAPVLPRLTRNQYGNVLRDLFGADLALPAQLEPDTAAEGLLAVGASITTVSHRGVELYEDAARMVATQVAQKPARLGALLPCAPAAVDAACVGGLVDALAPRLWRRPLTAPERQRLVGLGDKAGALLGTPAARLEYVLVAMLQSPMFLYRLEAGTPGAKSERELTATELAGKLALFLWDGAPDAALVQAAVDGSLLTSQGRAAQVDRMLADARARRTVRSFATQWLHLNDLDALNKDPNVFKHFSADLGKSAREETLRLVEHLAFDTDADFTTLLTTRTAFVDRRLAAIYNVPAAVADGFGQIQLPEKGLRRGLLGQVSFLGLHAHPVASSATLRGVFVREALLCDPVPPPPAGLNTAIPEASPTAKTLKQRLVVHMQKSSCSVCHKALDPIGFGLEQFDGLGRFRTTDHGEVIDPSGDLDGQPFAGFIDLGTRIAHSDRFRRCVVDKVFAYANGRMAGEGERGELERLDDRFHESGRKLRGLVRDVALSAAFARVAEVK